MTSELTNIPLVSITEAALALSHLPAALVTFLVVVGHSFLEPPGSNALPHQRPHQMTRWHRPARKKEKKTAQWTIVKII